VDALPQFLQHGVATAFLSVRSSSRWRRSFTCDSLPAARTASACLVDSAAFRRPAFRPSVLPVLEVIPRKRDGKQFFQRAREKGSENSREGIDGSEVMKRIEPSTEKGYQRIVDLWHRYVLCLYPQTVVAKAPCCTDMQKNTLTPAPTSWSR